MLTVQADVVVGNDGRTASFTLDYHTHRTKRSSNVLLLVTTQYTVNTGTTGYCQFSMTMVAEDQQEN